MDNHEQGICPICGSSAVKHGSSTLDGNCISYDVRCENCGADFEEAYTMTFDQHYNIKESVE